MKKYGHKTQTFFFGLVLLTLLAVAFLVAQVVRDLRSLNAASSDNVHWGLSQTEVELLDFSRTLAEAGLRNVEGTADAEVLEQVIIEFDLFYSRMTTLGTATLYAPLRALDNFGRPVNTIRAQLDAMIPLIDGPSDALRDSLPDLLAQAKAMRLLLREVASAGLLYFAEQSDQSRRVVAETLLLLAAVTGVMFLALLIAVRRSHLAGQQTAERGKELAVSYARLNTILETSLDAVIVADMNGTILNFNTAAERIFQYKHDDVIGKTLSEIMIPEYAHADHDRGMKRMRETGKAKIIGRGRVRLEAKRRGGDLFPVEVALQKATAGGDEVVIGFLRDISHRVASENELVEARDRALAGEKAKADFLAMMTHEIRTPLNGLLGNLSLLKKTTLDERQDHHVRNMDISGALLMHHVDSVLDVARFEAGAEPTQVEVVNMGQLFQDIVDSQSSAAAANGNAIRWEWAGAPVDWVSIGASRFQQVLLNLVGNAIKFTHNGQILIEAETSKGTKGLGIEVRVIDTGVGIPEDQQAFVFDDFHMVGDTGGTVGGTGLGLGIARRFVESMGGEIGLESTPGEGSVFWFHVPLERAEAPTTEEPDTEPAADMGPLDILLVEDNEINLDIARRMLGDLGHAVTEAHNGQQAVDKAEERAFDLILMDIRMPVMDGLQATKLIRAGTGPNHAAPIVAVSANVLPEARDRFLAAGMSGFMAKPISPANIQRVIDTYCFAQTTPDATPVDAPLAPAEPDIAQQEPEKDDPSARLIQRYIDETAAFFATLTSGQWDIFEIADEAHKIAGSAAAFGQTQLQSALIQVENAADAEDEPALEIAIAKARTAWENAPPPTLN